jgi:hypothetical protein
MSLRPGHLVKYTGAIWMIPRNEGVVMELDGDDSAIVRWETGFARIPVGQLQITGDQLEQQWAAPVEESGDIPG